MSVHPDRYFTLARESTALLREKASRFFAYAFPITSEDQFHVRCAEIAREHHTSRHVCHALKVDAVERTNDAGEPNGTAGKPILRQINAYEVEACAVVVVRYFGGTLLGKGGLVRAYGGGAKAALEANEREERYHSSQVVIHCTHALQDAIRASVHVQHGLVLDATYTEDVHLKCALPRSSVKAFAAQWEHHGVQVLNFDPGSKGA